MGARDICCNKQVEIFDPCKHGEMLVGASNSWLRIYEKWGEHPAYIQAAEECYEDGYFGAAGIMNIFIQKLLDNQKECD